MMADADDQIRDELFAGGDDGKIPRHTLFYFYDGDVEGLEQAACAEHFSVRKTLEQNGLILEKTLAVDELSFSPVSTMMESWARQFDAEYDGWECELLSAD